MQSKITEYLNIVNEKLTTVLEKETENIDVASDKIAASLKNPDNLLHIFGTGGHSMMAAEEIFHRAGGLAQIDPIFFASLSVINNVLKSRVERAPGIGQIAMRSHTFNPGEVMLIVSHVGVNSVTIDAAQEAKRLGLYVVGIESREICDALPRDHAVRHPDGFNLHEIADVTIDAHIPYGDAVIEIPGAMQKVAPISSLLIFFILHVLEIRVVEKMIERGDEPIIWRSGNIDGGDAHNERYHEKYKGIIKAL